MKTLIAIPCFNCEKQIPRVLESINQNNIDNFSDILIINNKSQDSTVKAAIRAIKRIVRKNRYKILENDENYGLGGSHKVAFNYAIKNGYDLIAIIHGDDQSKVEDLHKLIQNTKLTSKSSLGSRFMRKSKRIGYQKSRTFGNIVLNLIFTFVTLRVTKDLGSGINLFSTEQLKKVNYNTLTDSFNFNVELLLSFYRKDLPISFLPITWVEEDQISNAKNINVALSMLKSLFLWRFNFINLKPEKKYTFSVIYPKEVVHE